MLVGVFTVVRVREPSVPRPLRATLARHGAAALVALGAGAAAAGCRAAADRDPAAQAGAAAPGAVEVEARGH
jgi:hypothetical protein